MNELTISRAIIPATWPKEKVKSYIDTILTMNGFDTSKPIEEKENKELGTITFSQELGELETIRINFNLKGDF